LSIISIDGHRRDFASGQSIDLLALETVAKPALQAGARLLVINGIDRHCALLSHELRRLLSQSLRDPNVLVVASIDQEILANSQVKADLGILHESTYHLHNLEAENSRDSKPVASSEAGVLTGVSKSSGEGPAKSEGSTSESLDAVLSSGNAKLRSLAVDLIADIARLLDKGPMHNDTKIDNGRKSRSRSADRSISPLSISQFEPDEDAWIRGLSSAWHAEVWGTVELHQLAMSGPCNYASCTLSCELLPCILELAHQLCRFGRIGGDVILGHPNYSKRWKTGRREQTRT